MKITVLAVGKMRDRAVIGLCDEYRDRLGHHLPVEVVEVKKSGARIPKQVMDEEGERLAAATPDGALTVALTEEGKGLSSVELAQNLNQWMVEGRKDIAFYVGGAHGLSGALKHSAHRRWSLSKLTFPHDIARMLLWEQLYRGMTIIRREPYHK